LFYDQEKLEVNKHTEYPDPKDVFHREPMIAHITERSGGQELTLMGVHTDPDDVAEELSEMENAYNWATSNGKFLQLTDLLIVILSDSNSNTISY
jgi:hypothetical protein